MSMESLIAGLQEKSKQTGQGAAPQGDHLAAKVQTRAQQDLRQAVEQINSLKEADKSNELKKNYIRRVKQFPALVMTVGLAQAVAFSKEKEAAGNKALAESHRIMLEHVAGVLGIEQATYLPEHVYNASAADYRHMTRRVLSAWTYYRRFAVSILDPDGKLQEEGGGDE